MEKNIGVKSPKHPIKKKKKKNPLEKIFITRQKLCHLCLASNIFLKNGSFAISNFTPNALISVRISYLNKAIEIFLLDKIYV